MKAVQNIRKSAVISFMSLSALFAHYAYSGIRESDFSAHELEDIRPPTRRREVAAHTANF